MNKGKVDVLLGLQWGDEGKGKVILLSSRARSMCFALFHLVFSRATRLTSSVMV